MEKQIAVFQAKNGATASIYEPGKLVVYTRNKGNWSVLKEQDFSIQKAHGLIQLRQTVKEILQYLGECRVFVGLSVVGVPYYELEKAGFSVWEFEGRPVDFLDYILEQEEEALAQNLAQKSAGQNSETKSIDQLRPVEIANGYYFVSLKEIQANNNGVTSKQVLLPFLRKGTFYSLEIVCSHIPPWLEVELENGLMSGRVEQVSSDEVSVLVTKNTCKE